MQTLEFRSRVIFLCASALESARILLNSKTARFPTGLANSSGELGATSWIIRSAPAPTARSPAWKTARPSGTDRMASYVPRFRNVTDKHPQFVRGYGFQGGAARRDWRRGATTPGFGAQFKECPPEEPRTVEPLVGGLGECLPRPDNFVALHPTLKDKWGIPALHIHALGGRMSSRSSKTYR